jgi:hypothetical protein
MAIFMYMCGVSVAMIADVTGKQEKTVDRWILRIAPHCERQIKQELSKQNHSFTSLCEARIPTKIPLLILFILLLYYLAHLLL